MAIQEIFVRDFWWKLLAFVLATLIWANFGGKLNDRVELEETGVHMLQQPPNLSATVLSKPVKRPVTVLRGADLATAFRVTPPDVQVIIKGEGGRLRTLDPKLILAFVDVTDMNEKVLGNASPRPMSRIVHVQVPPGVEMVSVEPRSVIVERIPASAVQSSDSK